MFTFQLKKSTRFKINLYFNIIYSINIDHFDHIKSEINFKNVFVLPYLLYYDLISKH